MSNYRFYYKKSLTEGETLDVERLSADQIAEEIEIIVRAKDPATIHAYLLPDEGNVHDYIEDDSDLVARYRSVGKEWVPRPDEPGVEDYVNLGILIEYNGDAKRERDLDVILQTEDHGAASN